MIMSQLSSQQRVVMTYDNHADDFSSVKSDLMESSIISSPAISLQNVSLSTIVHTPPSTVESSGVQNDDLPPMNTREASGRQSLTSESKELFLRNSRLTQSMFTRKADTSRDREQSTTALIAEHRQRALDKREHQLSIATDEAMRQVEQTIRLTQTIYAKDDEIASLRETVNQLESEVLSRDAELRECRLVLREQQNQLSTQRWQTAESRSDADKYKVENMILSHSQNNPNTSINDEILIENERLKEEIYSALRQSSQAQNLVDQLQFDNNNICNRIQMLEEELEFARNEVAMATVNFPAEVQENDGLEYSPDDDLAPVVPPRAAKAATLQNRQQRRNSTEFKQLAESSKQQQQQSSDGDTRSKAELLYVIRRTIEDKIKWENYACSLIRRILAGDPSLLDCGNPAELQSCCPSEARWETYASMLLQEIMQKAPEVLNQIEKPNFSNNDKMTSVRLI